MIDRSWLKSVVDAANLALWQDRAPGTDFSQESLLEKANARPPKTEAERLILLGIVADLRNKRAIGAEGRKLLDFFKHLHQHFRDAKLTRAGTARAIGVSDSWLGHHLKPRTRRSFTTHINVLRLADARRLLLVSQAPIKQIAHLVGFPSANAFTTLFRHQFGIAPSVWRDKQMQRKE